jgi:flagellar motor switch protein FliN/FliY
VSLETDPMSEEQRTQAENAQDVERAIEDATEAVTIQSQALDELTSAKEIEGEPLGMSTLMDVPVKVTVEVGRTRMPLAELVELGPGSLVTLDREAHEPADILVNGKVVARGEVVTIDGSYGVRITSVHQ